MPIYEYRCEKCGYQQETLQKVSDPPITDCPQCHQPSMVKLISAAGFQLKGSGWYATDFKGSSSSAKSGDSAKAEAKAESKPEAKSDSSTPSGGGCCGGSCSCG